MREKRVHSLSQRFPFEGLGVIEGLVLSQVLVPLEGSGECQLCQVLVLQVLEEFVLSVFVGLEEERVRVLRCWLGEALVASQLEVQVLRLQQQLCLSRGPGGVVGKVPQAAGLKELCESEELLLERL